MKQTSFHKTIFKNTGLFGVSQFVKLFVSVFTNKAAALFLGPAGIGVIGLLQNVLNLILAITNFGISESSVREVALIDKDAQKSQRLIKIIYKWAFATGVLGALVFIVFSKQINTVVFNGEVSLYWIQILGLYFIFTSLTSIKLAVLKAKKQVGVIVKFNICLAVVSAITACLFYYFLGLKGIIPTVIAIAFSGFLISKYLSRTIRVTEQDISFKHAIKEGMPMAKIGVMLSLSMVFGQLCFYGIRWYLKSYHSTEIVGIYQVSSNVLVGYIGLVFVTMTNDYYPRLCNYENNTNKFNTLVNDQTELALLLVVPAVMVLYLIAPFLVTALYTEEFIEVLDVLKIGLFGVVLKAIVWPIGFIPLIKGNKRLFLKQNLLGDGLNIFFSILFFKYFGLLGLGLAMVGMFTIAGCYNYYVAYKLYNFRFRGDTIKLMVIALIVCSIPVVVLFMQEFNNFNTYICAAAVITIAYCLFQLKLKLKL